MKIVNLDKVQKHFLVEDYLAEELFVSEVWGISVHNGKLFFEVTSKISGSILMIILKSHIIKEGKTYKFSSIRDSDQSILFEFEAQP